MRGLFETSRVWIGCCGWYYRHWEDLVYPGKLSSAKWFQHYRTQFDTVELNAPFYRFPQLSTAKRWVRQAGPGFKYSLKVNREITHERRFQGTRRLIRAFYELGDVLQDMMGCFLFQLPPSFRFTHARLASILVQVERRRYRTVVEFRHASWWNSTVFNAFRRAGVIFCTVSSPRLPDDIIRTVDAVYIRFHGARAWYSYDYSDAEMVEWAEKIRKSGAPEVWAYFNNDPNGCSFRNAAVLRRALC